MVKETRITEHLTVGNKAIMRIWLITFLIMLFAVQAVAVVTENPRVNLHDQVHHQNISDVQTSHTEVEHNEPGHIHLCHHHHGEHTAKVLPAVVSLTSASNLAAASFFYLNHYENVNLALSLRPPILG